jgi:hypothetical protein
LVGKTEHLCDKRVILFAAKMKLSAGSTLIGILRGRRLTSAGGIVMESMTDILADTQRYRDEALWMIEKINAGAVRLAAGMTKDAAVRILTENIVHYDNIIRRYGCGGKALRPQRRAAIS